MLKILGRATSSNVQKVMWCIHELGVPHERFDVGGSFGGTKTSNYEALNPNRLVPTLDDDGFILWESNAIVRYIAAKHAPNPLYPGELKARASAERWMDWQASTVNVPMFAVFFYFIRAKPEQRDDKALAAANQKLNESFTLLDRYLAEQPYVVGQELTMGDIPIGMMAHRYFTFVKDRPPLPNVEAWYLRLQQREPFRNHVMAQPFV